VTGHEFHLAAAGGGSAGFGGGGGGGSGKGFALYILLRFLIQIALLGHGIGALVLVGLVLLWFLFTRIAPAARSAAQNSSGPAARRRTRQRERRVELAAAEAAEDDPAFAPDNVRTQAANLFAEIQAAWDRRDRAQLALLISPELFAEWSRRLDDFARRGWQNHVELIGSPSAEYVSLKHRGSADEDRVVVRIEARLRDYVVDSYGNHIRREGRMTETVRVREFWTLARRGDRWILHSIEQGAEGMHALDEDLIATPWSDEQSMRDEALVEHAVGDALPDNVPVAEVADLQFEGGARAAALDLSVADGRFSPDVLEVSARRAVDAWAEAVDGRDDVLYSVARGHAIRDMLHPGDPSGRTRLVVRGPRVKQIRITGLDASAEPPKMTIDVEIEGRRYIEDRDTSAVLQGSKSRATKFTERWTLALDDDQAQPWKIVAVGSPLARA
jgi:predicted lipid-binding transport protein (Tim44 family)